jgi:outer membrane protein TolC
MLLCLKFLVDKKFIFFIFLISNQIFANDNLKTIIQNTIANHPQFKALYFAEQSAVSGIKSAKYAYYPQIDIGIKKVHSGNKDINYNQDSKVATINLNNTLYAGGALDAKLDYAKNTLELKQAITKINKNKIINEVIELYMNFYTNSLKHQVYSKYFNLYLQNKNSSKRKLKLGVVSLSEYNLSADKLDDLNYKIKFIKLQIEHTLMQLTIKTGVDFTNKHPSLVVERFNLKLPNINKIISKHPELLQMKAKIKQLNNKLLQIKSETLPKLNLRVEHQIGSFSIMDFDRETRVFLEFFIALGGDKFENKTQAQLEIKALEFDILSTKQQLSQSIKSQILDYENLKTQITLSKNRIKKLEKITNSKQRLFKNGKTSWKDFLSSVDILIATKNEQINLTGKHLQLEYYFALLLSKI